MNDKLRKNKDIYCSWRSADKTHMQIGYKIEKLEKIAERENPLSYFYKKNSTRR